MNIPEWALDFARDVAPSMGSKSCPDCHLVDEHAYNCQTNWTEE